MHSTRRKQAPQKPPPGYCWIEDYEDEDTYIPGIATLLGITPGTFRKWRMAGKGPDTWLLGKRVTARTEAIREWLTAQEENALAPSRETRPPEPRRSRKPASHRVARAA